MMNKYQEIQVLHQEIQVLYQNYTPDKTNSIPRRWKSMEMDGTGRWMMCFSNEELALFPGGSQNSSFEGLYLKSSHLKYISAAWYWLTFLSPVKS